MKPLADHIERVQSIPPGGTNLESSGLPVTPPCPASPEPVLPARIALAGRPLYEKAGLSGLAPSASWAELPKRRSTVTAF